MLAPHSKGKGVKIYMIDSGCRASHQVSSSRDMEGEKGGGKGLFNDLKGDSISFSRHRNLEVELHRSPLRSQEHQVRIQSFNPIPIVQTIKAMVHIQQH
jgi:hypothetical protein